MLNISGLKEGVVLDHIQAGKSMDIYYHLGLDKLDCQVAIIKNARSSKMGRKDIIKVEGSLDKLDLDVLGYIDHNITREHHPGQHHCGKEGLKASQKDHQCNPVQEPPLHYLHRAGAAPHLLSGRRENPDLSLPVL